MTQFQFTYAGIFIFCACLFALTGITFLITVLFSRVIKTIQKRRYEILRDDLQKSVNALIILEHSKSTLNHFSLAYYLKELRNKIGDSFRKQLLIDLLIANKRNVKGDSAEVLRKVYVRLRLKRFSAKKLRKSNSIKKVQGLQELAEMECYDMLPAVQDLFTHRSPLVRQESFIATIRLASASPFVLVDDYIGSITPWMQLTIHKHLMAMPAEKLPRFYKWFFSANKEIRLFAINMAHQFRQLDATSHLAQLLADHDVTVAGMAAEVLGDFGAVDYVEDITTLAKRFPMDETLTTKVIRAIGKIGNADTHAVMLAWHMIHGSSATRLEAMRVMQIFNLDCAEYLVDFGGPDDDAFQDLLSHVKHPLLRT
jgi:hypothetical protein